MRVEGHIYDAWMLPDVRFSPAPKLYLENCNEPRSKPCAVGIECVSDGDIRDEFSIRWRVLGRWVTVGGCAAA
jgi:hypothetical protein